MNKNSIVKIFQHVLENDGANDSSNFFDLGGDSLLATRVLSAIDREYGVELSLGDLYDAPTPNALLEFMQREKL